MGKTYCGALFFRDRGTEGKNGRKSNKYNELPVPPGVWDNMGQRWGRARPFAMPGEDLTFVSAPFRGKKVVSLLS